MPRFIGNTIEGSRSNAERPARVVMVALSYSQAVKLDPRAVYYALNDSDRGGPRRMAKRWYNWFAPAFAVLADPAATPKMRAAAGAAIERPWIGGAL